MEITIAEVLKGCTPGRMQSAGYMQMIPLLSEPDMIDKRFGPFTGLMSSTHDYGTLHLENREDFPTILPMGTGVMTKSRAQNHATGKVKLMTRMSEASIDTAACIQETQGGTIDSGIHDLTILPYSIREKALQIKDTKGYSKLWPAIKEFNKDIGLANSAGQFRSMGHLEYYLDDFADKLDEFIGQFEIVENQVGAIILLNGQVAGIERSPNYEFWKELWKPLVRECYGSASLVFAKKGTKASPPLGRMPINDFYVHNLDDLAAEYEKAEKHEDDTVKNLIRNFIQQPFVATREENEPNGTLCVDHLSGNQFTGQIVRDSSFVVYASLIPDANARFNTAAAFSI
jgi:hypothetical protein